MEGFRYVEHLGFPFYVNEDGEVYSMSGKEKNFVKREHHYNADGYLTVSAYNPTTKKTRSIAVHIIVAKAFVPNPENKAEVNHKDFNRTNPKASNLEWMSHKENVQYSRKAGRYPAQVGEKNSNFGNRKLSKIYAENKELSKEKQSRPLGQNGKAKECILINLDNLETKEFSCQREAVYYLYEIEALNQIKNPETHITKLKRENGYKGYKIQIKQIKIFR